MSKRHFNSLAAAVRDWRRVCPSIDEADVAQLVSRLANVCQRECSQRRAARSGGASQSRPERRACNSKLAR